MTITGLTTASTIAAGGSLTFNAIFTPTSTATINGNIKLTTNGTPSPLTINVSGTGTAAQAQMTISPSPVAFNNVNVGSNLTQNVTLTNTGTAALNITAASITGTGYTMNLTAPKTINAGANSIFTVTFTPTSAGSAPGSISITSNAPGSPATIRTYRDRHSGPDYGFTDERGFRERRCREQQLATRNATEQRQRDAHVLEHHRDGHGNDHHGTDHVHDDRGGRQHDVQRRLHAHVDGDYQRNYQADYKWHAFADDDQCQRDRRSRNADFGCQSDELEFRYRKREQLESAFSDADEQWEFEHHRFRCDRRRRRL